MSSLELDSIASKPAATWIPEVHRLQRLADSEPECLEAELSEHPSFANYRLIAGIGEGGMGRVIAAWDSKHGRAVALKIFSPKNEGNWSLIQRFQNEVELLETLSHPNIVKLLDKGNASGRIYFAMNLVTGVPLSSLYARWTNQQSPEIETTTRSVDSISDSDLNNDDLDFEMSSDSQVRTSVNLTSIVPDEFVNINPGTQEHYRLVARIGQQVCGALSSGHKSGILHRDIKPSNLILGHDGVVWVADYGLAKLNFNDGSDHFHPTREGDIIGTVAYMPPCVIKQEFSPSSDLYSVGATLYELAACQRLWGEKSEAEILKCLFNGVRPTPIRKACPGIPEDLAVLIDGLLGAELLSSSVSAETFCQSFSAFADGRTVVAPSGTSNIRFRANNALRQWVRPAELKTAALIWGLAVIGFLSFSIYRGSVKRTTSKLAAANLHDDVATDVMQAIDSVGLLAAFAESSESINQDSFAAFADSMLENQAGVFSIGLAQTVKDSQRERFEQELNQSHDATDLSVLSIGIDGEMSRAPTEPQYVVVKHVVPSLLHAKVLGLNLLGDPLRKAAIESAGNSGNAAVAGPVVFYDQKVKRPGFVVIHAVERANEERMYAIVVFRFDDMLKRFRSPSQEHALDVRVLAVDSHEG